MNMEESFDIGRVGTKRKLSDGASSSHASTSQPMVYLNGTCIPKDGWFQACRMCRCWTVYSSRGLEGREEAVCRRWVVTFLDGVQVL